MGWLISLILSTAMADAVSLQHIFSEETFKGGIACSAVSKGELPGGFFDSPVQTYQKPLANGNAAKGPMTKLRISCTQGGGECECNILYTDEVDAGGSNSYFLVRPLDEGKPVWILTAKKNQKSMLSLANQKNSEIHFRNAKPEIFLDEQLTRPIAVSALLKIPELVGKKIAREFNIRQEAIEVFETVASTAETKILNSSSYTKFRIDALIIDPLKKANENPVDTYKAYKIRDIWIRTYDEKGRINFWLTHLPGC